MPDDRKDTPYSVYRSRPRLFGRGREGESGADPVAELQELRGRRGPSDDREPYTVHRARRGLRLPRLRRRPGPPRRDLSLGRIVRLVLVAALGWVLLSLLVFLVSAQLAQRDVAADALGPAGYTLTSPNTVLVLGSDARTQRTAEPGARVGGPSRSDSILLIRAGGGASARLSIPRDTVVDIPGHGRDKINAAFALGGTNLAVTTIEGFLGIEVNHVVEVDFENFPDLVDALGGIELRTGCVVSRINGGFRNGGFTLRLRPGENHLDGDQALALARTRKNECNRRENDLTRARRQQKIFAALKSRLLSPATFVRLPWVSWEAPQAIRSDMAGPSLLGLFGAIATGGSPRTRVLKPSGAAATPGGGAGLVVSEETRRAEVERFLRG